MPLSGHAVAGESGGFIFLPQHGRSTARRVVMASFGRLNITEIVKYNNEIIKKLWKIPEIG
jgi:predicted flavoprotein YhiN